MNKEQLKKKIEELKNKLQEIEYEIDNYKRQYCEQFCPFQKGEFVDIYEDIIDLDTVIEKRKFKESAKIESIDFDDFFNSCFELKLIPYKKDLSEPKENRGLMKIRINEQGGLPEKGLTPYLVKKRD